MTLDRARRVLEVEAQAILALANRLDASFEKMLDVLEHTTGRIILTGMGKSGIICRKIAATFASTGTPAFFLHPAEAIHGDLGMIVAGDTVIAISNSGETMELVRLIEYIKRQGATLISVTSKEGSTLATYSDHAFTFQIDEEGCPIGLAPMASTTTSLAIGDAMAAALMERKGFTPKDFARFHPGGKLGSKLMTVREVMHTGTDLPLVDQETPLAQALIEMSQKRLGMTVVQLRDGTLGLISDGDVRRLLQEHGPAALELVASDICTRSPKTIESKLLAVEALNLMEHHQITALIVSDQPGQYTGVIHLHDLWKTHMI